MDGLSDNHFGKESNSLEIDSLAGRVNTHCAMDMLGRITPEFILFLGKCLYLYNSYVGCDSNSNQPIHIPT